MTGKRLRMLRVGKDRRMQLLLGVILGVVGYMFVDDPQVLASVLDAMSEFVVEKGTNDE
jgi:hypothetical protein|tara:strand:+ start:74 stop:250 length:177 start_codon:yes stop_codon:yes gene_type:complete